MTTTTIPQQQIKSSSNPLEDSSILTASMMNPRVIVCKLQFGQSKEWKRFKLASESSFRVLKRAVEMLLNTGREAALFRCRMYYRDAEGDWIRFDSDEEWEAAKEEGRNEHGGSVVRLWVERDVESNARVHRSDPEAVSPEWSVLQQSEPVDSSLEGGSRDHFVPQEQLETPPQNAAENAPKQPTIPVQIQYPVPLPYPAPSPYPAPNFYPLPGSAMYPTQQKTIQPTMHKVQLLREMGCIDEERAFKLLEKNEWDLRKAVKDMEREKNAEE